MYRSKALLARLSGFSLVSHCVATSVAILNSYAHYDEVVSVLVATAISSASISTLRRLLPRPGKSQQNRQRLNCELDSTSPRLPVPSCSASIPPGPMLLLRGFLPASFTADTRPAESTVAFSSSAIPSNGMCAIDLRERAGCNFAFGLSMVAIDCGNG